MFLNFNRDDLTMNHIVSVINPEKSWCGAEVLASDSPFRTLDQAAVNGVFPSGKLICAYCVALAAQSLLNNIEGNHESQKS